MLVGDIIMKILAPPLPGHVIHAGGSRHLWEQVQFSLKHSSINAWTPFSKARDTVKLTSRGAASQCPRPRNHQDYYRRHELAITVDNTSVGSAQNHPYSLYTFSSWGRISACWDPPGAYSASASIGSFWSPGPCQTWSALLPMNFIVLKRYTEVVKDDVLDLPVWRKLCLAALKVSLFRQFVLDVGCSWSRKFQ